MSGSARSGGRPSRRSRPTSRPAVTTPAIRLPWWFGQARAFLTEMETGLAEAEVVRMTANEISDHPVLRAVQRARDMWTARGYRFAVQGPFGLARLVILLSSRRPDEVVVVCLDGPNGAEIASPHRNGRPGASSAYELCLFFPGDPESNRWVPSDGLVLLADLARVHVWKEHFWRTEGFWPGPEAPHGYLDEAA